MKIILTAILALTILTLSACSSSQETTTADEKTKEEVYVFDDAGTDVTAIADTTQPVNTTKDTVNFVRDYIENIDTEVELEQHYVVQVGAFTTKDKAELFVKENQKSINYTMEVHYSDRVNLFVVWLPKFSTKEEAESVRNILWQKEKFKDAFIVPIE